MIKLNKSSENRMAIREMARKRYENPLLKKMKIMMSLRMKNSLKTVFWRSMILSGLRMIAVSFNMVTDSSML